MEYCGTRNLKENNMQEKSYRLTPKGIITAKIMELNPKMSLDTLGEIAEDILKSLEKYKTKEK